MEKLELDDSLKKEGLALFKEFEKIAYRQDFIVKRTQKDKSIALNLLQQTIEELRQKKSYIEEANKKLETQSLELKDNLRDLRTSFTELEQFSYIASHDLRSPVRTIGSFAQLAQKRLKDHPNEEVHEFLNYIIHGATQMDLVISDLLRYSRAGGRDQNPTCIEIDKIVKIVEFNLLNEIRKSEATIKTINLPTISVLKTGFIQLLQNLIHNAIKFRSELKPIITIEAKEQKEYWLFSVSDNGMGLDISFQNRAFLPFQQLHEEHKAGTGIGLAICKKVVQLHGGMIWYEPNNSGKGTTFFFTIAKL